MNRKNQSSKTKIRKLCATVLAGMLVVLLICSTTLIGGAVTDEQPTVSVVNFSPKWGDKAANIESMTSYIEEAAENGTDIILFPEMAVTGYSTGMEYSDGSSVPMPVELAESKTGQTAAYFSDLAEKYDMYIVYGATETVEGESDVAYNSAFVCTPDGYVDSYQKISPVEGEWCKSGSTPKYFSTPWGNVALSICYDTYSVPEIGRLYSAAGCFLMLNPTAIVGGDWGWDYLDYSDAVYCEYTEDYYVKSWKSYYRLYLETDVQYDGMYIASSNILGPDGPDDVRNFEGGSLIIGPSNTVKTNPSNNKYDYITYYAGSVDNDNSGLATATLDVSLATNALTHRDIFQPDLYAQWYSELAAGKSVSAPTTDESPVCAVVDMDPKWGDKEANCNKILSYMSEGAGSVDIIVFPEMALTDYASTSDYGSEKWNMVIREAETTDGIYASKIAEKAKEYGMYVIYGTAEVNPDDADHPYNSAFVATPDGETLSYKKIQPVEGAWCTPGSEPLIVETPWGGMGISICMDTYSYPELERYYAAAGCKILVNPTASGGYAKKNFVYNTTLASIANRDGMIVLSSDLIGECGPSDMLSQFIGKSVIIGRNGLSPIFYTVENTSSELMQTATVNVAYTGFAITNFNPEVISNGYAALAADEDLYDYSGLIPASDYVVPSTEPLVTEPSATESETTAPATSPDATSSTLSTSASNPATTDTAKDNSSVKTGFDMLSIYIVIAMAGVGTAMAVYSRRKDL